MSANYETILANLNDSLARTAGHLDDLLADYEQTLSRLRTHQEGEIAHQVSAVIRALESTGAEALQLVVLLNHRRGDHAAARRAVEHLRRLEEITVRELRPNGAIE